MSPTCLESQGRHLNPSVYLLSWYSAYSPVVHSILLFSAFGPVSCLLSRNVFKLVFVEIGFFVLPLYLVVFVAARR